MVLNLLSPVCLVVLRVSVRVAGEAGANIKLPSEFYTCNRACRARARKRRGNGGGALEGSSGAGGSTIKRTLQPGWRV